MADTDPSENADASSGASEASADMVDAGSYEVIRARLLQQAKTIAEKAGKLNHARIDVFGGTELSVIGQTRVRTDNNCVPRDIVQVGGHLLFGYNVFIGLKKETHVGDVFSLHDLVESEDGFELRPLSHSDHADQGNEEADGSEAHASAASAFLSAPAFVKEFGELYTYYKETKLTMLRIHEGRLLAVFRIGTGRSDIKAFRWGIERDGSARYLDNRGDQDHVLPPAHDFEWREVTRDMHVQGNYPHISIEDECFIETTGGDLTIKIENNTESGEGIFAEPVEDRNQSLGDSSMHYARVGNLILLKILPYRETVTRYLVFNTRTQDVKRIDSIGEACIQLPENHGIIFPGGYYLRDGAHRLFQGESQGLEFERSIRSPNGEDVLYVFHRESDGHYLLFPYNLIRKEVQTPIHCHGYSLFPDGKMVIFRGESDEPLRVHPMQVWQTPFVSDEVAAKAPPAEGYLGKIGNADLVRGISDALSLARLAQAAEPTRMTYEDLIASVDRALDAYHWLGHASVHQLEGDLRALRATAEQVVDEFDKVRAIQLRAKEALAKAEREHEALTLDLRPDIWRGVDEYMTALTKLRHERGHLITLRELRYIDLAALTALEKKSTEAFQMVSRAAVDFLLGEEALLPYRERLDGLIDEIAAVEQGTELPALEESVSQAGEGLDILSEVIGGLQVDDTNARTRILEGISDVYSSLNRVRAALANKRKDVLTREGRAEFGAQFKLFSQSVASALAMAETPESCDTQFSRLAVQLEELEGRFGEFDEFVGQLTEKREEVYEAFGTKKQQLLEEQQKRAQTLVSAAERILEGVGRRARTFKEIDDLNAYFASDAMVLKLFDIVERLTKLGQNVRADELDSRLKSAKQEAVRGLRDRRDLYEDGANIIRLGRHRFSVNTQGLELTIVPKDEGLSFHLTGTDFYEPASDAAFEEFRPFWDQSLVSETAEVYRAEYLAASIFFDAESGRNGLSISALHQYSVSEDLVSLVQQVAASRYDEGYSRGVHDADAAKILGALLAFHDSAGLLRFGPTPRALAALAWAYFEDGPERQSLTRQAASLGRLRTSFGETQEHARLAERLLAHVRAFAEREGLASENDIVSGDTFDATSVRLAAQYLAEELMNARREFTASQEAEAFRESFLLNLQTSGQRSDFEEDLRALEASPGASFRLAFAWAEAFAKSTETSASVAEVAARLTVGTRIAFQSSAAPGESTITGLLGQHARIQEGALTLRFDEFMARLGRFTRQGVPAFTAYRELRRDALETKRRALRLGEFEPRVLSSFVRNRLIDEVYLPLIGDNLAKQLGSTEESKRTDQMGLLLLISPPGYGKTTLMEYIASRLGLNFMKVNGPSLGHGVHSLDPEEAPNATARQEVEKINLALEMGNNVMLYLDDIQHTHPELLQKFISLCDAQRRIEGVWHGKTRTYDLRGKKFCVIMAGNPYTESGDKFQIPDMLANRADTYNLGDILSGRDDVFALSYLENCLTSSPALAPIATRSLKDVHQLIRQARGEEVRASEFEQAYSSAEIDEALKVLVHLFRCQEVLLAVNAQYIASAAQEEAYREEPRFQLQGSYRNMNKLAEKVVAAMNASELEALIDDHYAGEAQTLTTGAEHNVLKLKELRKTLSDEEQARWSEIKREYRRIRSMGGDADDPVNRVTGTLSHLGKELESIRNALASAVTNSQSGSEQVHRSLQTIGPEIQALRGSLAEVLNSSQSGSAQVHEILRAIAPELQALRSALTQISRPEIAVSLDNVSLENHVSLENRVPTELADLLAQQIAIVERTIVPMVRTSSKTQEDARELHARVLDLMERSPRPQGPPR